MQSTQELTATSIQEVVGHLVAAAKVLDEHMQRTETLLPAAEPATPPTPEDDA